MSADKAVKRPIHFLVLLLATLCVLDLSLYFFSLHRQARLRNNVRLFDVVTSSLGLTDLCVSTEARYTRHPAVSLPVLTSAPLTNDGNMVTGFIFCKFPSVLKTP